MLEKGREVVALGKPRDRQVDAAHAGIEDPLACSIALVKPLIAACVAAGTDMLVELQLHDLAQGMLENRPHGIAGVTQQAVVVLAAVPRRIVLFWATRGLA
jgi:hypothetical protein